MEIKKLISGARQIFLGAEKSDFGRAPLRLDSDVQTRLDYAFDNAARSLGNSITRRDAIVSALAGFLGIIASQLGFKTAWAASTCFCGSNLYNPETQCCVGTGTVINKNPIPTGKLNLCASKVPHPGFTCTPNGCGGRNGTSFPNHFGPVDLGACCNVHDCCYANCNSDKSTCDEALSECITRACLNAGFMLPGLTDMCLQNAMFYRAGAGIFGGKYYDFGQSISCDCCGSQACQNFGCSTPGGCNSAPACSGSANCFCGTSIEGASVCASNISCSSAVPCSSTSTCGSNQVCVTNTCCGGGGFCAPVCGTAGTFATTAATATTIGPSLMRSN